MNSTPSLKYITHKAKILSVSSKDGIIEVVFDDSVDCTSCMASDICMMTKIKKKILKIKCSDTSNYKTGDEIMIKGEEIVSGRIMFAATILSSIILIASMIIVFLLTFSEIMALICGVGISVLLYSVIWLSRNKMPHEMKFSILTD